MAVVNGVVEQVKDGKRFKVNGEWYGSFNVQVGIVAGDTVTINWAPDKTGQYKNIKSIAKAEGAAPTAQAAGGNASAGGRDAVIVRQNALAHATALVIASGVSDVWNEQRLIIALAEGFARYSLTGEVEHDTPINDEPGF